MEGREEKPQKELPDLPSSCKSYLCLALIDELRVAPADQRGSGVAGAFVAVTVHLLQALGGRPRLDLAFFVHAARLFGKHEHDVAREDGDLLAALGEHGVA